MWTDLGWCIRICFWSRCMTSKFLYLNLIALYSCSLWWTDTIVFAKFNRLPSQISPPSLLSPYPPQMFLKYISSPLPLPPPVGLNKDLRYLISSHANAILVKHFEMLFRLLSKSYFICHFRHKKRTGAKMRLTIVSGVVTGGAPVRYWSIFSCR